VRIKKREEERLERLGPGGLDPAEVKTFIGTVRLNFAKNEGGGLKGLFASISRKMKGGGVD